MNNEPVNAEQLHDQDVHTVLFFSDRLVIKRNGELTLTPRPISGPCLLLGSEAFICSVLGCRCLGVFPPLACLTCFTSWWHLRCSKKEQLSKGDHQTLVVISLSESTWARTCWTGWTDWRRDGTLSTHASAACYLPHPSSVPHSQKIHRENFCGTAPILKICESFLLWKFPAIWYLIAQTPG